MALLTYPADAMPWVGVYICLASVICTLAMAADVFFGFRQRKLWFPCRYFTLNAASITLIAISTKLPVDLNIDQSSLHEMEAKFVSLSFLLTMVANFLPSLGLMNDKELVLNMVALCILIVTVNVNMWIQLISASVSFNYLIATLLLILFIPWLISVAFTVSASRRVLQQRYTLASSHHQEINFSYKELKQYVKKYWMMAETSNPQFAIACSPVSSAFGVICSLLALISIVFLVTDRLDYHDNESDYKWSLGAIIILQLVGAIVGSIAPIFRCLTANTHFNLSMKRSKHYLNVLRVEKHWIQRLQLWKSSPIPTHIPGRLCKNLFHKIRHMILNFCIALQITIVVICKTICLIPSSLLIFFSYCYHFTKSSLKRFQEEPNASNSNVKISDMENYAGYVLQIEPDVKLSKRILRKAVNSITRLLHESEKKQPMNLMKLLQKSTGFNGVVEFDDDRVPPLYPEETHNCWSLVAVTLTAIALALPNIGNSHINELLASIREVLQYVKHIEQCLNENDELVKARKAASRVWTDVEVYCKWLQIDLQKKARNGKTSEEILQWLGDEAVKTVIQCKRSKDGSLDHSVPNFVAASSMYRISQTILLRCNLQQNWPTDEKLFEFISTIIADMLLACFTNLPRVISMKCHENVIEKREDSIRTAAQLLGKSKKILEILEERKLPNLDLDSMAYIDMWHALPKTQIPNVCSSSARIQEVSSSSTELVEVIIV